MSLGTVLLFSGMAGAAIPIGALLAYMEDGFLSEQHHALHGAVIAFGGGVLIGAVVFVLVPEGTHTLSVTLAAFAFALGTGAIMLIDHAIERYAGSVGNLLAMMTDFVPEAIAFGALFGGSKTGGPLFAVLIALQNLPESYASFLELRSAGISGRGALIRLSPLAILGPSGAILGFFLLGDDPRVVGGLSLFAAGGIIYLVFQDVAPKAFEEGHWLTTAAASLGFLVALLGNGLTG